MRRWYDEYWKDISTLVYWAYLVLAYFDLVDAWVPKILIIDGVLAALSAVYLLVWYKMNGKPSAIDFPSRCFLIFILSMAFSALLGGTNLNRLAVLAFQIMQILTIAVALYSIRDALGVNMFLSALFAVVFLAFGAGLSIRDFDFERSWYRLEFLGTGTNSAGANFGIATIICLMLLRKKNGPYLNMLLLCLVPFFFYAQGLTKSRTAQLATALGFAVWGAVVLLRFNKSKLRTLLLFVMIILFSLLFLFAFLSSDRVKGRSFESWDELTGNRISIWKDSLRPMGMQEFFFGYGGNTERLMAEAEASGARSGSLSFMSWHFLHNLYLQIFVDYGIIALLSFLSGSLCLCLKAMRMLSSGKISATDRKLLVASLSLQAFLAAQNMMESLSLFIGGSEQMVMVTTLALMYVITKKPDAAISQ